MQVLHNSTTIKVKYEGVLHCGTIQQTVVLEEIYNGEDILRNEDRGLVRFSFKYRPEFVKEGETILLREGKTKIIGTITKIISWEETDDSFYILMIYTFKIKENLDSFWDMELILSSF